MALMKQFLASFVVVVFGLGIVMISALSVGRQQGFAQEQPLSQVGMEPSSEASQSSELRMMNAEMEASEVEYYLPYPGILPDHPLYFLKMVRDRFRLWTVKNSSEKLELLVLYADKRIGASDVLIGGGKVDLGAEVALKAEGYLERAVDLYLSDEVMSSMDDTLHKSVQKHKELLEKNVENLEGDALRNMESALDTNSRLVERLEL